MDVTDQTDKCTPPSASQSSARQNRTSPDLEIGPTSIQPDHFFKAIDIRLDGSKPRSVAVEALGKDTTSVRLIPTQASNTIRVTLDGVPQKRRIVTVRRHHGLNTEYQERPIGHYDEHATLYPTCTNSFRTLYTPHSEAEASICIPEIRFSRQYHQPTLRGFFQSQVVSEWYVMEMFAWHSCLSEGRGRVDEVTVAFTVIQDDEGRLGLICFASEAAKGSTANKTWSPLWKPLGAKYIAEDCASAGWRWLTLIDHEIRQEGGLTSDNSSQAALERLLLKILWVSHQQNMHFLETVVSNLWADHEIKPSKASVRSSIPMVSLRSLERSINELSTSIIWLSNRVQSRLGKHPTPPSPTSNLLCLETLRQDLEYYKRVLDYQIVVLNELHTARSQYNNKTQADNLNRLTILTACFLPLSLAAAVLSMQTRFAHLHLFLYDLVGVALIFGVAALTIVLTSGKLMDWYDQKRRGNKSYFTFGTSGYVKLSLSAVIYVFVILLTVSFLVGMLKDVILGLKVLGYETGGALAFLILFGIFTWCVDTYDLF